LCNSGDDALDESVEVFRGVDGWLARTNVIITPLMNVRTAIAWSSINAGSDVLSAGCHWATTWRASV